MESSIAEFLSRELACELLPTCVRGVLDAGIQDARSIQDAGILVWEALILVCFIHGSTATA
jgi:hypothetical protein